MNTKCSIHKDMNNNNTVINHDTYEYHKYFVIITECADKERTLFNRVREDEQTSPAK